MHASWDIIAIGGSTGGLDAVSRIVRELPARFQAAIVIVLHTATHSPRLLAELVGRNTTMPVTYAQHGDVIRRGRIYIAQPDFHLVVAKGGVLELEQGPKVRHTRPAADRLFESVARVYGARAIGVVLSGGDGDGADGLRAIKEAGGITLVQHPAGAENPGMPLSALAHSEPGYVVMLDEIGALLAALVQDRNARSDIESSVAGGDRVDWVPHAAPGRE